MTPADPRSVLDVLRARAASGGPPFADGARLALAIEGGAMRGVISAGMASALEGRGLARVFDVVYGSSAGAINGAYFLAGQATVGTAIYYEDINCTRFINLRRALVGRPIVDLGFLLDDVAVRRKRLDVDRVLASPAPLAVLATDVARRDITVLRGFADRTALLRALRAGATMPVIAGDPTEIAGATYLDASLSEPIPVASAERDGCTHILVLMTRSGAMRGQPSAFDRYFVAPRLARLSPELAASYLARSAPYGDVLRAIDAGTGPLGTARVLGVRVPALIVSKLERRADVLRDGARRGAAAIDSLFASGAVSR